MSPPDFQPLWPALASFAVSLLTVGLVLWLQQHVAWGMDKNAGIQKFHAKSTSRLGGVAIFMGMLLGLFSAYAFFPKDGWLGGLLMLACAPVFLGGLVEDFTHKVTPHVRLSLAVLSSALLYGVFQVGVSRTDIVWLDQLLSWPAMTFLLTVLVVSGFINAINIIDGFHGLAASAVMAFLCGLAVLAHIVQDPLVFRLCIITVSATLGFFLWNWPWGKIFLGDGGAYLLGFWVVVLGLMLPHRSPELSPMAPVLVGIYPLIETVYSMYRRKFVRTHPINHPDALHLHTLIYRRIVHKPHLHTNDGLKNAANAKVAIYMFVLAALPSALACVFFNNTNALLAAMALFAWMYVWFYGRIVHFKVPSLLR